MYAAENDHWLGFAADAQRLGSPLYAQLAAAIDTDAALKALTDRRREGQPPANLLLAAVHYLLLRGADHPLRNFYPSVGGTQTGGDVFALFQDFVTCHEEGVRELVESRVTNTNEVARSCVLRAGFAALAAREAAPLHLLEIGPSAGLNLIWDRYGMRYRQGETVHTILPDAPLMLDCELRGFRTPPLAPLPQIAGRVGLERDPVDLDNGQDRDWLRALIWPDQPARLDRLDRAIALFRKTPPKILGGDALVLLPDAMAAAPPDAVVCVYHTIAVYQFTPEMKDALRAILTMAGLRRPLWHLSLEFDGTQDYALTLSHHHDGACTSETLGVAGPHGGWLEWRAGS